MENNRELLMKHFASVLRGCALGKLKTPSIDPNVSRFFSRKQLIEIIKKRFDSSIPKEHNLVELENEELVALIHDEMYIISYVTELWTREPREANNKKAISDKKPTPAKPIPTVTKPQNKKKNETVSK